MFDKTPLGKAPIIAFLPITDAAPAKAFYGDALGLKFIEDSPFALVFEGGGTMLRLQKVEAVTPLPGTALGWDVKDIASTIRALKARGVEFLRFERMEQDALGIWTSPSGAKVAWFKDPDGNNLSLTQFP